MQTKRFLLMQYTAAIAGLILLPIVAAPTAGAQAPVSGPDLRDNVSTSLDPDEQALVRHHLNGLPLNIKEQINGQPLDAISVAIVDEATGTIHYNRPEDAGSYEIVPGIALPGEQRPYAQTAIKNGAVNPGVYGGSGPYRRVYTVPLPPAPAPKPDEQSFYQQSGVVTTPCTAGHFVKGDEGYAYMGGWSGTWSTSGAPATIDAGLAYNYQSGAADDYSVFMNLGKGIGIISKGNGVRGKDKGTYPQPTHIACSDRSRAKLTFEVAPIDQDVTVAPQCWMGTGVNANFVGDKNPDCFTYAFLLVVESDHFETFPGEHFGYILWVAPKISEGGWATLVKYNSFYFASTSCANCIFKWMTSIAQGKNNSLTDGSYYGAAWFDREISGYALKDGYAPGSALVPLTEGITDCSEYPLWHPPYSTAYQADCKNSPAGLKGAAQTVQVRDYSPEGEWDIIEAKY